jgi:hypothetical protein
MDHRTTPAPRDSYEVQLPWWAIALPAVAFAALLMLLAGSADARAATGSQSGLAQVLDRVQEVVLHQSR